VKPERLARAALRWHGRLEVKAPTLTMGAAELALAIRRMQVSLALPVPTPRTATGWAWAI
jgi:hypothetical protein